MKRAAIFLALLLPIYLLLGLGYVINGRVLAKPQMIDVGGSLGTDTTWTVANSPYVLTDTVTVEAGVTLTVEAGVTIMVMADMGQQIDVEGHLEAMGTEANPILITSIDDLATDRWIGINVTGSANFEYVTMRYAFTPLFITGSTGGDVLLENSVLEENSVHPIVVNTDALHRLKMNNVMFSNNTPNRVGIETAGGNLTLAGSPSLGPQPGLEGYEELNTNLPTAFSLPEGMTLTLKLGTNLMMLSTVQIAGHLDASGTVAEPVLWQTVPGGSGSVFSVIVLPTGTAVINQTTIKGSPTLGIAVVGESDKPVVIENSTLEGMGDFPMLIEPTSLHRVQMNNVTFLNNAVNRVLVDTSSGLDAIAADVTLAAQPGLEWYEFADANTFQTPPAQFVVPAGVTLTVASGVELRFGDGAEEFVVNGRLQAIGTPTEPITFTSAADSAPGEWEGIRFQGGNSQLENVVVRNGRENILIGTLDAGATVRITDSSITNSSQTPLGIQTSSLHQANLNNITFSGNPIVSI